MSKNENELQNYRVLWLIGSLTVIISFFLAYTYDNTLIITMQSYAPKMFDFISDPSLENITATILDIDFILLIGGAALSLLNALLATKVRGESIGNWLRLWNASTVELTGLVLFSSPLFLYENGKLAKIISFLGTEYYPKFDGLGIGYYLTWTGVIVSIFAGRKVTRLTRLIGSKKTENHMQPPKP